MSLIKSLGRKILLDKAMPTEETSKLYAAIGQDSMSERTFYYGLKRCRALSLDMESAPGTAEMILQLLPAPDTGASILDYGCGEHQSAYLKRRGYVVHSCDVLPMDIPNFTPINPIDSRLPFADRQFDVVIASEVLEHVESPWVLLQELLRIAKHSVIISTPNTVCLKSRETFGKTGYLHWFAPSDFAYHISPIFPWQVELFCKRHGVTLEETLGNHQAFQLPQGDMLLNAESLIFNISKLN